MVQETSRKISEWTAVPQSNAALLVPATVAGVTYRASVALDGVDPCNPAYGAVGDGVTDDKARLLLAITAAVALGKPVRGFGRTYGISGNLTLIAGAWLQDINFKQLTPAAGTVRTLTSAGGDNIRLERVTVNRNGDGTDGALAADAGIYIDGGDGHYFEDVEVYGDDMGTGFTVQNGSAFTVVRLHVHDINYSLGSSPGDDRVQGFWFNDCSNFRLIDTLVHDLGGNFGRGATTRYSRNTIGGCSEFTVINPVAYNIDQAFDMTGSAGNVRWSVTGGLSRDCYSHGFKFSSSSRDGTVTGAVAERCGRIGFVVSGPSEASLPILSGDIVFSNCVAYDTGSNGAWPNESGFRVESSAFDTDTPRGVRFIGCKAHDRQGSPTMVYGFNNDIAAHTDGRYNEPIDCVSIGHTTSAFNGFNYPRCEVSLTAAQQIGTAAWTVVNWDADVDFGAMHDTASSNSDVRTRRNGFFLSSWGVVFAANATGQRGVRILRNGSVIPGTTALVDAAAAGETALQVSWTSEMGPGDNVRIEVWQSSGGDLNLQTSSGGVVEQVG